MPGYCLLVEPGTRRLAAILVADAVGYSRMMADDEEATLAALRAHRTAIDPVILNHGGRIVKSTGDGVLVEFPSATDALRSAIEVQAVMKARNEDLPASRRMELRLGLNVGDVVVDEAGDVYGDGVNVAARVEPLADPGGIAITSAVLDAVRGKIDADFTDGGEHELKNIPRPVRVWRVGTGRLAPPATPKPVRRTLATVAVLPFDNMSEDAEQEYFADGITEDLLTALSYNRDLGVIARNSTFAYKGSATDVRVVARELDATHVVEGSVRKAGDRVRVTAQLIDAETGHHVWAERYDRKLDDIFELQDELVTAIAAKLSPTLWDAAAKRRMTRDERSLDAWDLTIRGRFEYNKMTVDGLLAGIALFERARELEPDFVAPLSGAAGAWLVLGVHGWRDGGTNPIERGLALAEAVKKHDSDDYWALSTLAAASVMSGRPTDGLQYARRMIEANPHASAGFHMLGANLTAIGHLEEAIAASTEAWRLAGHEPMRYDIANDLAYGHYLAGAYDAALTWGEQAIALVPGYFQTLVLLAAACGQLDRIEEGRRYVDAVLAARPDFSCARYRSRIVYRRDQDRDHIVDGLVKAGLPA